MATAAPAAVKRTKTAPLAPNILLEKMTDDERVMFTLEFGDVTDEKVVRDGKLRRPRLNKAQKDELDEMINAYYLRIAAERRAEQERRGI